MIRYYCIKRPPAPGTVPHIEGDPWEGRSFQTRRYIPEIDRMAWGWIECREELTPKEIADYGLIRQPREVEG